MAADADRHAGVSVIVPAHDEEATIGACLDSLRIEGESTPIEVIVVANGCTDRTAEAARSRPWVRVIELPAPSKAAALAHADAVATYGARVYVDGDVVLTPGTLASLVEAVAGPGARIVAPAPSYRTEECDAFVRAYYAIKRRLPSTRTGTVGRGVYAVSAEGRDRFGSFEGVMADDFLAAAAFGPEETLSCPGTAVVEPPRTVRALVDVRTRIARGNRGIRRDATRDESTSVHPPMIQEVTAIVREEPRLAWAATVFVAVSALARVRARTSKATWLRDTTTR